MGLVESFDNFAGLRNGLLAIAGERGDWAGIPMPLDGQNLVIEPNFPNATALEAMTRRCVEDDGNAQMRNCFYSRARRCDVVIWEEDGKIKHGLVPAFHHVSHDLQTLGASVAWGLEQEQRALQLLATLVRHHQMKQYVLAGMFLESSERSGLIYMFRRLKPTVVIDARKEGDKNCRILCALCLRPIGYYEGSWAGAMCPTDDVISHLMLMRGDEPMLWRRANQHAPHRPEAGL